MATENEDKVKDLVGSMDLKNITLSGSDKRSSDQAFAEATKQAERELPGASPADIEQRAKDIYAKIFLAPLATEIIRKVYGDKAADAFGKQLDKGVDLQYENLQKMLIILESAAQAGNELQKKNAGTAIDNWYSNQQMVIKAYFEQATAVNSAMTGVAAIGGMIGGLMMFLGNEEKGTELISMSEKLQKIYSTKTLEQKEFIENLSYGPNGRQFARMTQGNKEIRNSVQADTDALNEMSKIIGGKMDRESIAAPTRDGLDNPLSPKHNPKDFSTDGFYPKGIPAGGPVKDHKADTVKPYSPADVRRYAAAALAPSKWDPTIAAAAEKISKETGISTSILAMEAKIRIGPESGGNPNAWNGGKGAKGEDAYGLMQLTPDTAKQYGVTNIKDPQQNIEGGLRFIAHIVKKYGRENVDLYYYGGEGKKDHGPNTRQYVENLGAVRTLLPKDGFEIAQASSEPKKEASKKQADEKKETASVLPPFAAVAGLDNQIPGTDTRGLKTDAGALLARNDENKPKEGKVGDPSSTAQNDQRYPLIVGAPAPSGGFTGT
jgi:hypothetical protein